MLIAFALSCQDERGGQGVPEPKVFLELDNAVRHIDYTINEFPVKVSSNCEWSIDCLQDWVSWSPEEEAYAGSLLLHVRVRNNAIAEPRTAEMIFRYDRDSVVLTIHQEAFEVYLRPSVDQVLFGYRSAEKHLTINSNCGWYARTEQNWISIKPSTGLVGNYDMVISVETNPSSAPRAGKIDIWNDTYGCKCSIDVSQEAGTGAGDRNYVDEYGVDRGKGVAMNGLVWAPVNCGYHQTRYPYGKLYQWGRKCGIGYADGKYQDEQGVTIADIWDGRNGAESPAVFYKASDQSRYGYDWIMEGDDSFWNLGTEENPVKNALYDPCPEGWRVPTAFEYRQLLEKNDVAWVVSGIQSGVRLKRKDSQEDGIFLPAGGRLNISDGLAYDRNVEGYYWTITTSGAGNSSYLYFYSGNCTVNSQGSRAGGCLVRCVGE